MRGLEGHPRRAEITMLDLSKLSSTELADLAVAVQQEIAQRLDSPTQELPGAVEYRIPMNVAATDRELTAADKVRAAGAEALNVKLHATRGEVLEYVSTLVWWLGERLVRIACMGGDVEQRRSLLLVDAKGDSGRPVQLANGPAVDVIAGRLYPGTRLTVHGTRYEVKRQTGLISGVWVLEAVR